MKAKLVKVSSEEFNHNLAQSQKDFPLLREKRRSFTSFNPIKNISKADKAHLQALDEALTEAIARYQHSLDNLDLYSDKQRRRLKRKALASVLRIKAFIQSLNQHKPDRKVVAFFYREVNRNTKADCKIPKRVGYGLRAPLKDNNPKRGKAVLPIVNPAYVVSRSSPTDKIENPGPDKPHTGYVWELKDRKE